MDGKKNKLRIGLAGFGGVGRQLAECLLRGDVPGAVLSGVTSSDLEKARLALNGLGGGYIPVTPLALMLEGVDLVVECATAEAFPAIAEAVLVAGKRLVAVSVAALPNYPGLEALATLHGGRIHVASGGLPGLDAVRAVKEGHIDFVRLRTTFRPESLANEPFVRGLGFDFTVPPKEPVKVFEGTAREAGVAFPRHFNVGITLSLAGIGFDKTEIEVWVDSDVEGAVQHIEVKADIADLTLISRNRPSKNPRTSRIVAPSVLAVIRTYLSSIQVGS
ncbi:aspartate dehydrogenase domain-containing protein [Pseudomonas syringae]|uniref:aspartate dehydrogenase domain-containing protein n=1 Tax=Pseudomonas syringae TaxID=317 RepID=UPI00067D4327|nr:aspartate dehydrogenase domain-containing protein [Pseudomonas syringae]